MGPFYEDSCPELLCSPCSLPFFACAPREKALAERKRSLRRRLQLRITAGSRCWLFFVIPTVLVYYIQKLRRREKLFHIIHMHFLVHFQAQRPEQSVMQALESLSDSQVRLSFFMLLIVLPYGIQKTDTLMVL